MASCESIIRIFDAPMVFEQPATCDRSVVDIPDAMVDVCEADVLANADV